MRGGRARVLLLLWLNGSVFSGRYKGLLQKEHDDLVKSMSIEAAMRSEVDKLRKQIKQYKLEHEAFMESLGAGGERLLVVLFGGVYDSSSQELLLRPGRWPHLQTRVFRTICSPLKSLTRSSCALFFLFASMLSRVCLLQDELEAKAQRRARKLASEHEVEKASSSSLAEWQKKADKMKKKQVSKQRKVGFCFLSPF